MLHMPFKIVTATNVFSSLLLVCCFFFQLKVFNIKHLKSQHTWNVSSYAGKEQQYNFAL